MDEDEVNEMGVENLDDSEDVNEMDVENLDDSEDVNEMDVENLDNSDTDSEEFDGVSEDSDEDSDDHSDNVLNHFIMSDEISINKDIFTLRRGTVSLKDLIILKPLRDYRAETYAGLRKSIQEMGILTPIFVTPSESFLDWKANNPDLPSEEYTEPRYKVIDGFRRVYAALKNGISESPAIIIEFTEPELAAETSVLFSLILNKFQKHSWAEVWGMYQVLEAQSVMTPSTLEWVLRLDSGDAMRLKDIMMSGYEEIIEDLTSNKKTITSAYAALQKARKGESLTQIEDTRGVGNMESVGSELASDMSDQGNRLSDAEVRELLDMANTSDEFEATDENFGGDADMFGEAQENYVQDTHNRERISPELKSAILRRDGFMCQCCHMGEGITSNIQLSLLQAHHITAVYTGGSDSSENFVTLCTVCHDFVHLLVGFNCKIGMTKEEFDQIPEYDQRRIRNCIKYAKILAEAERRSGKSLKKYKPEKLPFWSAKSEADHVLAATREALS